MRIHSITNRDVNDILKLSKYLPKNYRIAKSIEAKKYRSRQNYHQENDIY